MDVKILKENASVLIPTGALVLSTLYLLIKKRSKENDYPKEIPWPSKTINWPLFGHVFALGDAPLKKITQWHKETGSIYKMRIGNQVWVMISDPQLAHDIFVKASSTTSSRPYHRYLVEIYGRHNRGIVFSQYNTLWRNKRKAAISILSPSSIEKFHDVLQVEIESLMDRFAKISQSGEAVYPFKELEMTSMNVILTLSLATRFEDSKDPTYTIMHDSIHQGMIYSGAKGDLGSYFPFLGWTDYFTGIEKKLHEFIHDTRDVVYEQLIKNALESERHSLIKDLYKMKEEGLIDEDDIMVFMSDLVGAGSETIASTLLWALAILSQHPDVQDKLIRELDEWKAKHSADAIPNFHRDRDELPYSICVQKEVMRFRPVTSFGVPHMASEDTVVDGYLIPKGVVLISSMTEMHQSTQFYNDPQEFRPERFSENTIRMGASANAKVEERDHFGFGWGKRICPGIHLAEVELFNFFVHFFSRFTIETELDAQGNPVKIDLNDFEDFGIVNRPIACKFRILPRHS